MEKRAEIVALVEHLFHIIKNIFRHHKMRYRGLEKNTSQLRMFFALVNLCLVRRWESARFGNSRGAKNPRQPR